jgi:hypothetical protein
MQVCAKTRLGVHFSHFAERGEGTTTFAFRTLTQYRVRIRPWHLILHKYCQRRDGRHRGSQGAKLQRTQLFV